VAALTAHLRLRRQLSAEGARLEAQLAAEQHRMETQLAENRLLHDLGEYREVLDAAAASLWQLRLAWNDVGLLIKRAPNVASDESDTAYLESLLEARVKALEGVVPLLSHYVRLIVRFGREHPVAIAFDTAFRAFAQIPAHAWPIDERTVEETDTARRRATTATEIFFDKAQEVAGAKVDR
jgi:hypothetical protein